MDLQYVYKYDICLQYVSIFVGVNSSVQYKK